MPDPVPATCRERFLNACFCRPVDRPPIWMMRQAGRSLPEYRALKKGRKFTELVRHPELAAEITLQPVRRFGYDAAVIFSDILAIPEAMGQNYTLMEQGGICMNFQITSATDVDKLDPTRVPDFISYTPEAIRLVRRELGYERAIIGFAGSPWTVASFMIEGGSFRENTRSRALFYGNPTTFRALLKKITAATITYLNAQIEAGADVIQIFDSLGGTLSTDLFWEISGRWIKQIIDALDNKVPTIVFARNVHHNWNELVQTGTNVLSIDWSIRFSEVCREIPASVAVQGNLDPALLLTEPETAVNETRKILNEMNGRKGFIFNLGHGVPPHARVETIRAVTQTVQCFKPDGSA